MRQIVVNEISGGTTPISVYISDIYGNNQTLLSVINTGVPPIVDFTNIPAIFLTAPEVLLKMVDVNNCEVFKVLPCIFGDFIVTQNNLILITQNGNALVLQ